MTDKKTLVVVESPTKAKTISRYLGDEYAVTSSMGHLIDLPKSRLAVDIDNGFEPDYITIRGRGKILKDLKWDASRSKRVYLAADSDREGEAISFHIGNAIKKDKPQLEVKRIVFNEITEDAIKEAVRHPREIDTALVRFPDTPHRPRGPWTMISPFRKKSSISETFTPQYPSY